MKAIIVYAAFIFIACFIVCFISDKIKSYNKIGCDFNNCENCTSRAWCSGEVDEWDEWDEM